MQKTTNDRFGVGYESTDTAGTQPISDITTPLTDKNSRFVYFVRGPEPQRRNRLLRLARTKVKSQLIVLNSRLVSQLFLEQAKHLRQLDSQLSTGEDRSRENLNYTTKLTTDIPKDLITDKG